MFSLAGKNKVNSANIVHGLAEAKSWAEFQIASSDQKEFKELIIHLPFKEALSLDLHKLPIESGQQVQGKGQELYEEDKELSQTLEDTLGQ